MVEIYSRNTLPTHGSKNLNNLTKSSSKEDLISCRVWDGSVEDLSGRLGSKEDVEEDGGCSLSEEQVQDACLRRYGLFRYKIIPDGNCLFRAVARALFGDQNLHSKLRHSAMEHISENLLEFLTLFDCGDEDLMEFSLREIERLRKDGTWGGIESLMSLSDLYNVEFFIIMGGCVKNSLVTSHQCHHWEDERRMVKKVFLIWTSLGHYDLAQPTYLEAPETQQWYKQFRDPPHTEEVKTTKQNFSVEKRPSLRKVKEQYQLPKDLKSDYDLGEVVLKKFSLLLYN